ncbi:hypothetical protein TCAL_10848 [Tigriopus californicus]|uniref:SET domain-containing protein n=1 Tax=Tigriopus californicus TaxID=6832 RepID=A0A553PKX6_TIGCA|nr:SET domain-containing protein SmydA-8-like isoform X1 [Tigriopus californicus]TRY78341.1 hypothetical protein TCAL_10848 [Tigriopus californicus]
MPILYEIKTDPAKGNILVAKRDIQAGELIFNDRHIVLGPKEFGNPKDHCISCFKAKASPCLTCELPFCHEGHCSQTHQVECDTLFQHLKSEPLPLRLALVAPYRLARAMADDSEHVQTKMEPFMDHEEARKALTGHQERIAHMRRMIVAVRPDLEQILNRVFGLLHVNALDVRNGLGRALFPTLSYVSHSCVPNSRHIMDEVDDDGNLHIRLYSQVTIPQGQEITITYTNLLRHTFARQAALRRQWFFSCHCERCSDPTELKSGINLVYCPSCTKSYLMPDQSEEDVPFWSCLACLKAISEDQLQGFLEVLKSKLDAIQPLAIEPLEKFLLYSAQFVHNFHYLCLIAKRYLSQLYDETDADQAAKKRLLSHELMIVFDALDPGYSQSRGLTMIEMVKSDLALAEHSQMEDPEFQEILKEKIDLVHQCLDVEPKDSLAGEALKKFNQIIAK